MVRRRTGTLLSHLWCDASQGLGVTMDPEPVFTASMPRVLFEGSYSAAGGPFHGYDIAPSGEYFVFQKNAAKAVPKAGTQQLNVVLNWSEELKRRAPSTQ